MYNLITLHKPAYARYSIDAIFARYGHKVLRLPPYHPKLNPIGNIWAIVKNWVATKNVIFKLDNVEKLAREKFALIGAEERIYSERTHIGQFNRRTH